MDDRKEILKKQFKFAFYSTIGEFINVYTFLVLFALVISLSWIPDGLFYLMERKLGENTAYKVQLGVGILILIILFIIGWVLSRHKFPEFEIVSKTPSKKRNLILFLSKGNIENLSVPSIHIHNRVNLSI